MGNCRRSIRAEAGTSGVGFPAIRIRALVSQLGGVTGSICAPDFDATLTAIGTKLSR